MNLLQVTNAAIGFEVTADQGLLCLANGETLPDGFRAAVGRGEFSSLSGGHFDVLSAHEPVLVLDAPGEYWLYPVTGQNYDAYTTGTAL